MCPENCKLIFEVTKILDCWLFLYFRMIVSLFVIFSGVILIGAEYKHEYLKIIIDTIEKYNRNRSVVENNLKNFK